MKLILRFFVLLLMASSLPSCVATYVDPVSGGWEGPAATVVVGSATAGMVGYHGGYYRRPYARAGYYGRSYARGYWRPYAGRRPGRF